ncbi:MAG: indole-3-glycerol phosphate synthase TrpC, partial [Planctomycetota bacterium]
MILDDIMAHKREEVEAARRDRPIDELEAEASDAPPPLPFAAALTDRDTVALIAEIKRASPSAGLIREDFDPARIAACYREAGAAALSVLTDRRFFRGRLADLRRAKAAARLPTLRKDFVLDPYQVYEARAAGADAILLIVRVLSDEQLRGLLDVARGLGMAALVEAHAADEVERAVAAGARTIGVNNRDLDTLAVDLHTTEVLAPQIPADRVIVSESGIAARSDVERLARCGC